MFASASAQTTLRSHTSSTPPLCTQSNARKPFAIKHIPHNSLHTPGCTPRGQQESATTLLLHRYGRFFQQLPRCHVCNSCLFCLLQIAGGGRGQLSWHQSTPRSLSASKHPAISPPTSNTGSHSYAKYRGAFTVPIEPSLARPVLGAPGDAHHSTCYRSRPLWPRNASRSYTSNRYPCGRPA